ncbi:hypothetical protein AB1284_25225 [Bacillus sp. S2(2024)]|uniref:hypothetical protein n=1 Tax=Bacillus sp. S2(2024) TaxID=3162887 RepID=UPI003D23AB38
MQKRQSDVIYDNFPRGLAPFEHFDVIIAISYAERYAARKVAQKSARTAVVYLRKNLDTGKLYVGRAKSYERYVKRQVEHAKKNQANYEFRVLTHVKPGRQARRYEQKWINRLGGIQRHGGRLENSRYEISRKKWKRYRV